jgi:AcrR family transcriptional regulator
MGVEVAGVRGGTAEPPPNAPKHLSREDIIATADRLARGSGIDGFRIRELCEELGVTPPTVYWHVRNKHDLVLELVDTILGRVLLPGPEAGDWRARLRAFFASFYDEVAPYPGLGDVMARELATPAGVRMSVYTFDRLLEAGLCEADAVEANATLMTYTMGQLLYGDLFLGSRRRSSGAGRARRSLTAVVRDRARALSGEDLEHFRRITSGLDAAGVRVRFLRGIDRLLSSFGDDVASGVRDDR